MCHLILMLPLLGLPVFWIWPASVSVPVYTVVFALSVYLYFRIMRMMHVPVRTGAESILHDTGEVIEKTPRGGRVRVQNELWDARCKERLHKGDRVRIIGRRGLVLTVERLTGRA